MTMNPAHNSKDYQFCMQEAMKDCESVLEPGCEFGSNFRVIQRPIMVGVEIHAPYLASDRVFRDPRVQYICADAKQWMKDKSKAEPKSFDAVMMIDFIEHFEKPDSFLLLNYAEILARKKVWLWVPEGHHPQDYDLWNMGGDEYQTHRSTWSPDDLRVLGYDVAHWPHHHGPTNAKGQPHSTGTMFALKTF